MLAQQREEDDATHKPNPRDQSNVFMLEVVRKYPFPTSLLVCIIIFVLCAMGSAGLVVHAVTTNK